MGQVIGKVVVGNSVDVDRVVVVVSEVFKSWKNIVISERVNIIVCMVLVLGVNMEELLGFEVKCIGLLVICLQGFDIFVVMQFVQIFLENLESYLFVEYFLVCVVFEVYDVKIVKQFFGVCGLIIVWNGFLFLVFLKMLLAIVVGNIVIIKFVEIVFLVVVWVMELIQDLLFLGVVNVVIGFGLDVGVVLFFYLGIVKIFFIGFGCIGVMIQKEVVDIMKWVILELGGKGFGVVLFDVSIELMVRGVIYGFLLGLGQICIFGICLFVYEFIYDELVVCMVELVGKMKVGSQFDLVIILGFMVY